MPTTNNLDYFKLELSVKAKNGINFILAASVVWTLIAWIWTLSTSTYNKGVLTFMAGGILLPLAWVFSKIFKTQWTVENNPLQPLGLWFNFAQLFYFPILIFIFVKNPAYMVMVYVVITGAHFFPYAWFYQTKAYAVMAGVISIGAMSLSFLYSDESQLYLVPAYMVVCLVVLALFVYRSYSQNKMIFEQMENDGQLKMDN